MILVPPVDASGYLPVRAATLTALLAVRDAGQCLALAGVAGQERSYVDRYKHQFGAAPVDIHELDTVAGHFADDCLAVEEDEVIAGPDSTAGDLPGQVETRPLAEMDDPFDHHPEVLPGGANHPPTLSRPVGIAASATSVRAHQAVPAIDEPTFRVQSLNFLMCAVQSPSHDPPVLRLPGRFK